MTIETALGSVVNKIFTSKMICLSCKRSFVIPKGGELECGECEHCGNTSYHIEEGRPWGHRHSAWDGWVRSLWELTEDNRVTEKTINCLFDINEIGEYLDLAPKALTQR